MRDRSVVALVLVLPLSLFACSDRGSPPPAGPAPEAAAPSRSPADPGPVSARPELSPPVGTELPALEPPAGPAPELRTIPEERQGAGPRVRSGTTAEATAARDGKNDLVWRNPATGEIVVWTMDGLTRADDPAVGVVSPDWEIVAVGDHEGNGSADDLVWRKPATGELVIWVMNGTTRAEVVRLGRVNPAWRVVGVGDFQANGTLDDLLWRHESSGDVVVWFMDGTTKTGQTTVGSVPTDWKIVGVGYYGGDSWTNDPLWRHQSSGDVVAWTMDGASKTGVTDLGSVSTDWTIHGTGDYDGTGLEDDIVWRRAATGEDVVWLMDLTATSPTSRTGVEPIRNVGGAWTIRGTAESAGLTVSVVEGAEQTADPGATLPTDPRIQVTGFSNVDVTFRVAEGGGTVNGSSSVTVTTDASGSASVSWTLGPDPGNNVLVAELTSGDASVRIGATGLPEFTDVAAGGTGSWGFACGLGTGGKVFCWGHNRRGQLGIGAVNREVPHSVRPREVDTGAIGDPSFTSVVAGDLHACALDASGNAYCWGGAQDGQTGTASTEDCDPGTGTYACNPRPTPVADDIAFDALDPGLRNTCGLATDGTVYCWGQNGSGQLGASTSETCFGGPCSRTPVLAANGMTFVDIAIGFFDACGITGTGDTYCWGDFSSGGTSPAQVVSGISPVAIESGSGYHCAVVSPDSGACWGPFNDSGRQGDGTTTAPSPAFPTTPTAVAGQHAFDQIAANDANSTLSHTCGVTTDEAAWCWGADEAGQLGGPSGETCTSGTVSIPCSTTPVAVQGGLSFQDISVGGSTCGVATGGEIYCWGQGDVGQLGTAAPDTCTVGAETVACATSPVRVGAATEGLVPATEASDDGSLRSDGPFDTSGRELLDESPR